MKKYSLLIFISVLFFCCNNESDSNESKKTNINEPKTIIENQNPLVIEILPKGILTIGDTVTVDINTTDSLTIDSVRMFVNNQKHTNINKLPYKAKWSTYDAKTGTNKLNIELYSNKTKFEKRLSLILSSNIEPKKISYKIIKTYKHDVEAYTQGLFFHNDFLYEATGLMGQSSVRKVKLETGEILQSHAIPSNIFGEGITLYNNKIIQLSWQSRIGFVYNIDDFQLIRQFNYPTEGWGITTINDQLYMSDGTSNIYILETSNFSEVDRIEVYDNKGPVAKLNELEYINELIYANIYMTDKIARIDPKTGKVLAYINCEGLLQKADQHPEIDVLNGIAFDKTNNRIFVTGKKWPKLFEIEFVE